VSTQFWVKLFVALSLLPLTFFTVHSYRKGALRELRAKWLRRKIVASMEALLPHVQMLPSNQPANHFPLFRLRAELEQLAAHSDVLLIEEKNRLNLFLANLSALFSLSQTGEASTREMTDVLLLGQRVIHESTELGF